MLQLTAVFAHGGVAAIDGGLTVNDSVGTGTLTLASQQTYTGNTTLVKGTLAAGTNDILTASAKMNMAGGTFSTGGMNQSLTATALLATAPSKIDMAGVSNTLQFSDSVGETWASAPAGTLLRINNWTTTGGEHIIFSGAGLIASQLNLIHFTGYQGTAVLTGGELFPSTNTVLTRGDLTGEGAASGADLTTLLSSLANPAAYLTAHGYNQADYADVADVNRDGAVDNADIQAEIYFLINGTLPSPSPSAPLPGGAVPEPASMVLLAVGGLAVLGARYRRRGAGN